MSLDKAVTDGRFLYDGQFGVNTSGGHHQQRTTVARLNAHFDNANKHKTHPVSAHCLKEDWHKLQREAEAETASNNDPAPVKGTKRKAEDSASVMGTSMKLRAARGDGSVDLESVDPPEIKKARRNPAAHTTVSGLLPAPHRAARNPGKQVLGSPQDPGRTHHRYRTSSRFSDALSSPPPRWPKHDGSGFPMASTTAFSTATGLIFPPHPGDRLPEPDHVGPVNRYWKIESLSLSESAPGCARGMGLILKMEGDILWGLFAFGMIHGVMRVTEWPNKVLQERVPFIWRERDRQHGHHHSTDVGHGWMSFFGDGQIDGAIVCSGKHKFEAVRQHNLHVCPGTMPAEWNRLRGPALPVG